MQDAPESHAAIEVCKRWKLQQPPNIKLVSGGFSGASVFRVEAQADVYCLRRWPAGEAIDRLSSLHRVVRHVAMSGVEQVPVPEAADDGRTLVVVDQMLWQIERWMPGHADFHQQPSAARLRSAINVLARWHRVTAEYMPAEWERRWIATPTKAPSPTIRERCESLRFLADNLRTVEEGVTRECDEAFRDSATRIAVRFSRVHRRVKGELAGLLETSVPLLPCLRDVWHDHLLFTGDALTGLIDFGAIRTDTVACDLSRVLGSLFGASQEQWPVAFEAYESIRSLSLSERALIGPLHRSGILLSGMTWLKRRYLQRSLPVISPAIRERVKQLADTIESLDSEGETVTAGGLILP